MAWCTLPIEYKYTLHDESERWGEQQKKEELIFVQQHVLLGFGYLST